MRQSHALVSFHVGVLQCLANPGIEHCLRCTVLLYLLLDPQHGYCKRLPQHVCCMIASYDLSEANFPASSNNWSAFLGTRTACMANHDRSLTLSITSFILSCAREALPPPLTTFHLSNLLFSSRSQERPCSRNRRQLHICICAGSCFRRRQTVGSRLVQQLIILNSQVSLHTVHDSNLLFSRSRPSIPVILAISSRGSDNSSKNHTKVWELRLAENHNNGLVAFRTQAAQDRNCKRKGDN